MAGQIEIEIYDDFPADYQEKLSTKARAELKTLLAQLQVNPYEPSLQKKCILHEDEVFEYPLSGGYSILWKVHHPGLSITALDMKVFLLAIERTSKKK
ncbi:MAG: hypothetical protein WAL85_13355 [Candidatus Korobacteraceae bacterium]